MLSTSQLNDLLDEWSRAGAPVANALQPGLSASEIVTRLEQTVDLPASHDLVTLWCWRNGTDLDQTDCTVGPHLFLLSLDAAIEQYHLMRTLATESAKRMKDWGPAFLGQPEYWWRPTWVPLLRGDDGRLIAAAVDASPTADTPIWSVYWGDYNPEAGPILSSAAALVETLRENVRCGLWSYQADEGGWLRDRTAPHDRRLSPAGLG
jgi:cell wall assembly regulator SMI1